MRIRILLLAAAAAAATALLAPAAHAARLPDWAKPIAEAPPPVPEGVPRWPSRTLLRELRFEYQKDGTSKVIYRTASQALSVSARDLEIGGYGFGENSKVTSSKAWHIPPGERAERSWDPPVDVTAGDAFLTSRKVRLIHVDDVKKGSLVFYEFQSTEKPYVLPFQISFGEETPTDVARLVVATPPGWTVRHEWQGPGGAEPVVEGDVRTWELRNLPALEEEPLGLDHDEQEAVLSINPIPPSPEGIVPAVLPDWKALSLWYEGLLKGRADATPQIEAAVKKATDGGGDGLFERVQSSGRYVRDSVRYVSIQLGIGGYQPAPAQETLANLYGDCKAKATLLRSFLGTLEHTTYPVLVNLGPREPIPETIPVMAFNHLVEAVPVPADKPVPDAFRHAIVDGGDLGPLLIVDTTQEKTSIGSLYEELTDQRAFVVAGEKGRLVTLPHADPAAHTVTRSLSVELQSGRTMRVHRVSSYYGDFATNARSDWSASSMDRRKGVEVRVMHLWPDARLTDYAADPETPSGEFVETIVFDLKPPAPSAGGGAKLEIFTGAAEEIPRVPLGKRKGPVDYRYARTWRYAITFKGFPEETTPPQPVSQRGDGWSVTTTYVRKGTDLEATWEVVLTRTRWEPDAFPDLRKFWSAATSAASWTIPFPS